MSNLVGTYDHTLVNISVEGVELSDFVGDVVITKERFIYIVAIVGL